MVTHSAQGGRLNRRGVETRQHIIDTAVRCLASGDPAAVSANFIAKQAGVTWGTIQHHFGDSDGVWSTVLDVVSDQIAANLTNKPLAATSLAERIRLIVEGVWTALDTPASRAVQNLRLSLPRTTETLARDYPATAGALHRIDTVWTDLFDELLGDLVSSKTKVRRVRSMLPGALRGIHTQAELSTLTDIEEAKRGIIDALVAYLGGSSA